MWHETACNIGQMGMSTTEGRVLTSPKIMTISVIFAYRERFFASLFQAVFMRHEYCKAGYRNRKNCAQIQALYANKPRKVGMNTTEGRVEKAIGFMTTSANIACRRSIFAAFFSVLRIGKGGDDG